MNKNKIKEYLIDKIKNIDIKEDCDRVIICFQSEDDTVEITEYKAPNDAIFIEDERYTVKRKYNTYANGNQVIVLDLNTPNEHDIRIMEALYTLYNYRYFQKTKSNTVIFSKGNEYMGYSDINMFKTDTSLLPERTYDIVTKKYIT